MTIEVDVTRRFGGIARLYGEQALSRLDRAHIGVLGIGGVGSWVAEALARSGVGALTLIDLDHVAESNINRQIQALDSTLGQAKVQAMRARIHSLHPQCQVTCIEDFIAPENFEDYLRGLDGVVDAIDSTRTKAALIAYCRARGQYIITVGGAGGQTDPTQVRVVDLSQTIQDPLLSKVRSRLRKDFGFTRTSGKKFGVEAVFSLEPQRQPLASCDPGVAGQRLGPQGLHCAGYGSSVAVTATFGFAAASRVLEYVVNAKVEKPVSSASSRTQIV